jgi:hypothetical protein
MVPDPEKGLVTVKIERSKIVPGGHFSKVKNFRIFSKYFFGLKFSAKKFFFFESCSFGGENDFHSYGIFWFFFLSFFLDSWIFWVCLVKKSDTTNTERAQRADQHVYASARRR